VGTTIASANWALTNVYYAAGETIKYQVQKQRDRESKRLIFIIIVILCKGADEFCTVTKQEMVMRVVAASGVI
jgi:hypothetical protein